MNVDQARQRIADHITLQYIRNAATLSVDGCKVRAASDDCDDVVLSLEAIETEAAAVFACAHTYVSELTNGSPDAALVFYTWLWGGIPKERLSSVPASRINAA